ncbi:MAG: ABC transporter permease [Phycisphaerales bacterium]|jgi:ABC-type dipeptide/oligopeptide/nickel transport system permease component|nr:ABC transporter permease [Phycisphaerales bacterium]
MASYILRRLLLLFPTLIGITIVTFLVMALSPGGIGASLIANEGMMRPEERQAVEAYLNQRYGLDKPLPVQYLRWLNKISPLGVKEIGSGWPSNLKFGLKSPDLGESFIRRRPVGALIAEALPVTLLLNAIAVPIIYILSIWTGILAARHRGKFLDVGLGTSFIALWSIPTILMGVLLIGFLSNDRYVHWFPTNGLHTRSAIHAGSLTADQMNFLPTLQNGHWQRGWLVDLLWHMVLPVFCLVYGSFAILSKLARGAVLDNLTADYARTARAKGLGQRQVLYHHVFRNSLLPLITVAAEILPGLIGGSVIVETIFGIQGMGKLAVDAVFQKDPELVLSETVVVSLLTLVSYLLADILYAAADPRVSYE